MRDQEINYYLGTISEIYTDDVSKEYHIVKVNIPGVIDGVKAFPKQGEIDEPRIGDQVLLLCLDPTYFSYLIYTKLKETDFIGFRASGKMIDITPEALNFTIYKDESANKHSDEDGKEQRPEPTLSQISMKDNGDITIDLNSSNGTLIINSGINGGLINISDLKMVIEAMLFSLKSDDKGAMLDYIWRLVKDTIEDKRIKH